MTKAKDGGIVWCGTSGKVHMLLKFPHGSGGVHIMTFDRRYSLFSSYSLFTCFISLLHIYFHV
jgi:hypothetical protein